MVNFPLNTDVTPVENEVLEEMAVKKALVEAAKDLEKPNIITKEEEDNKKKYFLICFQYIL